MYLGIYILCSEQKQQVQPTPQDTRKAMIKYTSMKQYAPMQVFSPRGTLVASRS